MWKPGVLENADKAAREYTGQSSAITRSLGLAVVGVIWLFAGGLSNSDKFAATVSSIAKDNFLFAALASALAALTLDVLQYLLGAWLWSRWKQRLVLMLFDDKLDGPPTAQSLLAWKSAAGRRIAGQLNDWKPPPNGTPGIDSARDTLRTLKAASSSAAQTDLGPLDATTFPTHIGVTVNSLFWIKSIALFVSYVCLLIATVRVAF